MREYSGNIKHKKKKKEKERKKQREYRNAAMHFNC